MILGLRNFILLLPKGLINQGTICVIDIDDLHLLDVESLHKTENFLRFVNLGPDIPTSIAARITLSFCVVAERLDHSSKMLRKMPSRLIFI